MKSALERRTHPDRRCQHARVSFTCVCGLILRRDVVFEEELIRCPGCLTLYSFKIGKAGWKAVEKQE